MPFSTLDLTKKLDQIEHSLPPVPSKSVALGRATIRRTNDVVASVVADVTRRFDRVAGVARTGTATTVGQTREAGERTAKTATTAVRQTVGQARAGAQRTRTVANGAAKQAAGQARAQARRTGSAAAREAKGLLADAAAKVDPDAPPRGTPYEQWTKAQLYQRAQELDIDGRATMSKPQLVKALRAA